jgi:hypothetical protein
MSEIEVQTDLDILNNDGTIRLLRIIESDKQIQGQMCLAGQVVNGTTACANGTYIIGWPITDELDGLELKDAWARVKTKGATSTMNIQFTKQNNNGTLADMLRTQITMGDEYFASDGVVNATNKGVSAGNLVLASITQVHSTPAKGLWVAATFGPVDP